MNDDQHTKPEIPASLREQLRAAAQKGVQAVTPEERRKYGKAGWAARVRKAQEAEQKAKGTQDQTTEQNQQ